MKNNGYSPVPKDLGEPVTDFGHYQDRPWLCAQTVHRELYRKLEAKYKEAGISMNRTVMALRESKFYEAEEFAVLMDYLILKMPRYVEAILKLQLVALNNM